MDRIDDSLKQRPMLEAFERLYGAVVETSTLEQALWEILSVFIAAAGAESGVLRYRSEGGLRLGASVAANSEPDSVPLDESIPRRLLPALTSVIVPLIKGNDVVGLVDLRWQKERELGEEALHVLSALAPRAAHGVDRRAGEELLVQSLRSRDDVLAVVAHDLRNPLNVISVAANSLMSRLPDSPGRRPVERIVRGVQRADRLIRDLLEINAIEGGRFVIDRRPVETADLILSAVESQQSLAAGVSVIFATDLSPDLARVEVDEERMHEVLENLVGNAVKFTTVGGTVTVGATQRDAETLFWVKDTGTGIPAEHLPHLFDRFWQAKKKDRRGTGLGLTICKAIVEAHGGKIWAESKVGQGTTMFFTIPTLPSAADVPRTMASLLLVDDRPENLLALKSILERPDYRLVTATSGEEALRLALRDNFAVALIDIAMPGMDGLEVAEHLKQLERCRDVPILFITAFGDDPQEIHRAYSAGGADYLVKPLDAEIVRKKVGVFVNLSRRRQQEREADHGTHEEQQ